MTYCGFVSLVGSPNAGKSSLLNKLLNRKVSIVSDKVQTTRDMILGIYNDEDSQIIFLDTPGFHKPNNRLQVYMNHQIDEALQGVDLIIYILDAQYGLGKKEQNNIAKISKIKNIKKICLINKIDLVNHLDVVNLINELEALSLFSEIFAISIKNGFKTKALINDIKKYLPQQPRIYDQQTLVNYDEKFYIEEIIREKINYYCFDEIPHNVSVLVENINKEQNVVVIDALIFVARKSQKGIIIGKSGQQLKKIGIAARKDLTIYFDKKVYLNLHVKVLNNWDNNQQELLDLGYEL